MNKSLLIAIILFLKIISKGIFYHISFDISYKQNYKNLLYFRSKYTSDDVILGYDIIDEYIIKLS